MSAGLFTSGCKQVVVLQPNVTFNNLKAGQLTLKELFVDKLNYKEISSGDDTLPDIFFATQVDRTRICQVATIPASGYKPTNAAGNDPTLSELTLFSEPIYFNNRTLDLADPLNPYITAAVSCPAYTEGQGWTPGSGYGMNPVAAATVANPSSLTTYNIPYKPSATVSSVNGAWFGVLSEAAAGTLKFGGQFGATLTAFVYGSKPSSPPAPWGNATVGTPANVSAGVSRTKISFDGGIVGSCVQFPATFSDTSNLSGNLVGSPTAIGVYPVYPVNTDTPSSELQPYGGVFNGLNTGTSPYYAPNFTTGVWIQQIWWVTDPVKFGSVNIPSIAYNITHLFTLAGNSTTSTLAATPLNVATLRITGRAAPSSTQSPDDGAFQVWVDLPETLVTTAAGVTGYTFRTQASTAPQPLPTSFSTLSGGQYVVYLATQAPSCVSGAVRASTNETTATGNGGESSTAKGGTFSINPDSCDNTKQFPVTQPWAGNLPLGFIGATFRPVQLGGSLSPITEQSPGFTIRLAP